MRKEIQKGRKKKKQREGREEERWGIFSAEYLQYIHHCVAAMLDYVGHTESSCAPDYKLG